MFPDSAAEEDSSRAIQDGEIGTDIFAHPIAKKVQRERSLLMPLLFSLQQVSNIVREA